MAVNQLRHRGKKETRRNNAAERVEMESLLSGPGHTKGKAEKKKIHRNRGGRGRSLNKPISYWEVFSVSEGYERRIG